MRIAIGGIWHETNTFAAATTPLEAFEVHEASLIEAFRGTRTPLGGFLDAARARAWEVVPTLYASATPSGLVERPAYESLADRLLARLSESRPDAILLDLHGAMVVDGLDEPEADLLARIRRRLGAVPAGVVFDFHANIGDAFVRQVDVFAGYDTYPHVDPYERALDVAELLERTIAGRLRPVLALARPPLLTAPPAQQTGRGPMRDLMALAREAERRPGMLKVTVAGGFPYADVPHAGLSVVAASDGRPELARSVAAEVAEAAWAMRAAFRVDSVAPDEAVERALRRPEGPVILVDVADNVGGGSPGDGTVLLEALLRAGARGAVVTLADPEAVARAFAAGEGARLSVAVGRPPIRLACRVERVGSGDFTYKGSYMTGRRVEAGRAAVLACDGVRVLVRERKVMPFDAEEIRGMGIEPAACRIIVVKSALAWRSAYGDIARAVIDVDTPGPCTARLETLPYRRLRRPIAPLDEAAIGSRR
ncbi:MAG TPA: M81 family metallopeptidase [Planctomycetota bacterium]|nr:M81 family metallopeptidase [Planctomycetota bacterium]